MGATIASNLLDVIATSYATEHSVDIHGVTRAKSRKLQVKRFVEGHLREPRLTPGYVASSLNVSTRYIRMLFAEEDEQLSRYILRRRLEKCAEQLRSCAWTRTTITNIAFSWGFRSMPHFARVFRARFGMTPREYRKTSAEP
jgi:AraC-like DNA-binding protein